MAKPYLQRALTPEVCTEDGGKASDAGKGGLSHEEETVSRLFGETQLRKIAAMVKTRIEVFNDIEEMVDFFRELPEYSAEMYAHKKMKTTKESSLEVLAEVLPLLERQEDYSNDGLYGMLARYVEEKGCKNGFVMWPIRTAVSGKQMTPAGATEIMEILGREETVRRIRKGMELLQNA